MDISLILLKTLQGLVLTFASALAQFILIYLLSYSVGAVGMPLVMLGWRSLIAINAINTKIKSHSLSSLFRN